AEDHCDDRQYVGKAKIGQFRRADSDFPGDEVDDDLSEDAERNEDEQDYAQEGDSPCVHRLIIDMNLSTLNRSARAVAELRPGSNQQGTPPVLGAGLWFKGANLPNNGNPICKNRTRPSRR